MPFSHYSFEGLCIVSKHDTFRGLGSIQRASTGPSKMTSGSQEPVRNDCTRSAVQSVFEVLGAARLPGPMIVGASRLAACHGCAHLRWG